LPRDETLVAVWALQSVESISHMIDTVLLLTRTRLYIAIYDEHDKLHEVHGSELMAIDRLEMGTVGGKEGGRLYLRIQCPGGMFTWRPSTVRLFNNTAIALKSEAEADEYLGAIAEQLKLAANLAGNHRLILQHRAQLRPVEAPLQRVGTWASKLLTRLPDLVPIAPNAIPSPGTVFGEEKTKKKPFRDDTHLVKSGLLHVPSMTTSKSDHAISQSHDHGQKEQGEKRPFADLNEEIASSRCHIHLM